MMQTYRLMIRHRRDQVAQDKSQPDRLKEFSYGLIYDALGWTPGQPTMGHLDTLVEVIKIADQDVVTQDDFMTIRHKLVEGGFNVSPLIEE